MARITIRPLRQADTADMHELMHMPNVLWGTAHLPSTPLDRWQQIIERWLQDENRHIFVADIQNKVVGMVRIVTGDGRKKHVGSLAMAVHDKYQGQGIGKMLMLTAIDLADNWLNLIRLELDVYTDNERALRLYKNFDFEIEGRIRCSSFRAGKYIDSYLMARIHVPHSNGYSESVAQVMQGTAIGQGNQQGHHGAQGQQGQQGQQTQQGEQERQHVSPSQPAVGVPDEAQNGQRKLMTPVQGTQRPSIPATPSYVGVNDRSNEVSQLKDH